jgi:hypothetical protein
MRVSVRTYELTRRPGNFFGGDLLVEDQRPVSTSWSAPRIPGLPLGGLDLLDAGQRRRIDLLVEDQARFTSRI